VEHFDLYTIKARLFPAIIALFPAVALLVGVLSLSEFDFGQILVAIGLAVLFSIFSGVARRAGKRVERKMYRDNGGYPTFDMLTYDDRTFSDQSKARYLNFLGSKIGTAPPTMQDALADPAAARDFYNRAGAWLRENTRDVAAFRVLFDENITYGFYRNLLGLKPAAVVLNVLVSLICGAALAGYDIPLIDREGNLRYVLGAALLHLGCLVFFVNEQVVRQASHQYGRQLLLACDALGA